MFHNCKAPPNEPRCVTPLQASALKIVLRVPCGMRGLAQHVECLHQSIAIRCLMRLADTISSIMRTWCRHWYSLSVWAQGGRKRGPRQITLPLLLSSENQTCRNSVHAFPRWLLISTDSDAAHISLVSSAGPLTTQWSRPSCSTWRQRQCS
jgi:hypothetical protein